MTYQLNNLINENLEYFFNEIELWEVDEFNDINIVIWSPDYNCYSGGIIALNYLAHLLNVMA